MKRVLAFVVMFALVASAAWSMPGLALTMAPALLLLALLTGGVRPGEALIDAPARPRVANAGRHARTSRPRPRLALVVRPAGRQLASALAMRPPPSGLAVLHLVLPRARRGRPTPEGTEFPWKRSPRRSAAAAAVTAIATATAFAHDELKSTYARQGQDREHAHHARSRVTFTAAIRSGTLKVTGPGGKTVSSG